MEQPPKPSTQGRARSGALGRIRAWSPLGVPSGSGNLHFEFAVISLFWSPLSVSSFHGIGTFPEWDRRFNVKADKLDTMNVVRTSMSSTVYYLEIQGWKSPAFELNIFPWFEQKVYEQRCNRSNAPRSYSWDYATGSVSFSKNVSSSRTWGYLC